MLVVAKLENIEIRIFLLFYNIIINSHTSMNIKRDVYYVCKIMA